MNVRLIVLIASMSGMLASPAFAWRELDAKRLLVKAKDPLKRESAALVLGRRGDHSAVGILAKRMKKDKDPWVRARCAEALGLLGSKKATRALKGALAKEKRPRVRRAIGAALFRLGDKTGLLELMWQLKSGTNYSRAEAMRVLVSTTGRPLAQDRKRWWSYLAARGYQKLKTRPPGSPALVEFGGRSRIVGAPKSGWKKLCAVVLRLEPARRRPIDKNALLAYEKLHGAIPDGCVIFIETRWASAKKTPLTKNNKPQPDGPGLAKSGIDYLLTRAPRLLGIGIDTPTIDLPSAANKPIRKLLREKSLLLLEAVDGLEKLNAGGTQILLVQGKARHHLIAVLP